MLKSLTQLHTQPTLRRVLLPVFERLNPGNVTIRHHYTGDKLYLHSFRHKGYWFHGKNRERRTMQFFEMALSPGDTVLEVGGHIGYLTLYFSQLAGPQGKVVVFEPGGNNLPYIRRNVSQAANVTLIEKAISDTDGTVRFYEESLTGQNNSMLADYKVYRENCARANASASHEEREVQSVKIDTFVQQSGVTPALIKIDIEGAEWLALTGAEATLADCQPIVMVEVTENKDKVFDFFSNLGYRLFQESGEEVRDASELDFNAYALHPHRRQCLIDFLTRGSKRRAA